MTKYYRAVIVHESLWNYDPVLDDIEAVIKECRYGDASGMVLTSSIEEVTAKQMSKLLIAQGSEPECLIDPCDDEFYLDYQDRAYDEGWCVSTCMGSSVIPEGWMQIEMFNDDTDFKSDLEALAFVTSEANHGSEYHRGALAAINENNFALVKGKRYEF